MHVISLTRKAHMSRKFFFFDIDGTLVPGSGNAMVPQNTRQALKQLEARGHFLAIATGRAHCLAEGQMKQLGFQNMVSDGGNAVTINGELQEIEPLPRAYCIQLADECEAAGYPWACGVTDSPVRIANKPEYVAPLSDAYQPCVCDPSFDIHTQPKILRMFVSMPKGREHELAAFDHLPCMRYEGMNYIFVEPANKDRGIRRIMDEFGATDEDIVVFGDGINDLGMFRPEWTCICMGNGCDELKARADYVTRDADDDGIGHALRHFGWID